MLRAIALLALAVAAAGQPHTVGVEVEGPLSASGAPAWFLDFAAEFRAATLASRADVGALRADVGVLRADVEALRADVAVLAESVVFKKANIHYFGGAHACSLFAHFVRAPPADSYDLALIECPTIAIPPSRISARPPGLQTPAVMIGFSRGEHIDASLTL